MCGICGEITFNGKAASFQAVKAMTERMAARGPDATGFFSHDRVALGHRRLKIIDLSDKAAQPMEDEALGLVIVYNGAIYNYPVLRRQLSEMGYRFFSRGDTEVILKAYHAWGPDCVKHFNGMFAFAIWERESGRLFLARDRLGIKPLYYTDTGAGFRFASSLPALLRNPDVDKTLDPTALHHYMTFHSVVPAPHTILKGVRKLPPASTLTIEKEGGRREEMYWRIDYSRDAQETAYTIDDWKHLLLEGLQAAVRRRLVADVPVGVLLSGGLDSSLVVGLLAENGQNGLNTFSIGFEDVGDEEGNEFRYSDIIAAHFGTTHHKIAVGAERTLAAIPRFVAAMNEPMVSHDCVGFYLLSEQVSRHVKVVQSGQGADEVFAGYHWYPPMMTATDPESRYADLFFDRTHAEYLRAVDPRFAGGDHSLGFVGRHFAQSGADDSIDKVLRIDTTVMLVDDPVKRVDNMTMAWGLEARVPFLDHELVELAAKIPGELKIREGGKYILKEVARQVIPEAVIDRPKGYFPVPAFKYLRGDFLVFVKKVLTSPEAAGRGVFNPRYIETLLSDPENHITPLRGSKLWQAALLEYWLQTNGI